MRYRHLILFVVCSITAWGTACAYAQAYDFESLQPGKPLAGQDGWTAAHTWETADNSPDVAQSRLSYAMRRSTYSTGDGTVARPNDARYSFTPHTARTTLAAMQFDVRPSTADAMFGVGRKLSPIDTNQVGPQFGFLQRFLVRGAAYGQLHYADLQRGDEHHHWYRLRLVMDLAADGGDGRGTLYVMNLSRGERSFRPQPALKDVPLGFLRMEAGSRDPATWDSLFLRSDNSNCQFDNLIPNVPNPTAMPPVPAIAAPARFKNPGQETVVAAGGKAAFPVVVGYNAGDTVRKAALDLAERLSTMSGAEFRVVEGDGTRGIAVGTPRDLPAWSGLAREFGTGLQDREAYTLKTHAGGILLLGARPIGARHAVWDLLHRLGYRQYFPSPVWECLPKLDGVAVKLDVLEKPDFIVRNIWWPWLDSGPYETERYQEWCERNRLNFGGEDGSGFVPNGGHIYEEIIAANRPEFDAHPEYMASVGGMRQKPDAVNPKFNYANPGLHELVKKWAIAYLTSRPDIESLSMTPSDGGGWDDTPESKKLGSISDQVVGLANEVAEAVNAHFKRPIYVHIYMYSDYSAPPSIRLHPMLIVEQAQWYNTTGYTYDELWAMWQKQGARTGGTYEYLDVFQGSYGLPGSARASDHGYLIQSLAKLHAGNRLIYTAESNRSFGANGRGYYLMSRMLWDAEQRNRGSEIFDDFVRRSFGAAAEPMRRFYDLLERRDLPEFCHERIGQLYGILEEAWKLTTDQQVRARLSDLAEYLHYTDLALQAGFDILPLMPQQKVDLAFELTKHAERMRDTPMVCLGSIWRTFYSPVLAAHPDLVPRNTQYDIEWPQNPLRERRPFTGAEIENLITEGQKRNPTPAYTAATFSNKLVPATPLALPAQPRLSPDALSVEWRTLRAYVPLGRDNLVVRLKAGRVPNDPSVRTRLEFFLADGPGAKDASQRYKTVAATDGEWHEVALPAPQPGLYILEVSSNRAGNEIDWAQDQLIVDWPEGTTFPNPTQLYSRYFYVPKGTREVAGFTGRTSNGEVVDAAGNVQYKFDGGRARIFVVPVPPGQDGKVWLMRNVFFSKLLLNVPTALARSPQELILPEEVVARDSRA